MKPKHNRVMCPECFKQKMLFEAQKQADNFIKWNGDDIDTHGGELRSYYCPACGGWHITSKPHKESYEHNTENLIKRYEKDIETSGCIEMPMTIDYINIFNEIPKDIINSSKKAVKEYLTKYFTTKGIENKCNQDNIRCNVYKLLKKYKYKNGKI
jgi:hypothetical protein